MRSPPLAPVNFFISGAPFRSYLENDFARLWRPAVHGFEVRERSDIFFPFRAFAEGFLQAPEVAQGSFHLETKDGLSLAMSIGIWNLSSYVLLCYACSYAMPVLMLCLFLCYACSYAMPVLMLCLFLCYAFSYAMPVFMLCLFLCYAFSYAMPVFMLCLFLCYAGSYAMPVLMLCLFLYYAYLLFYLARCSYIPCLSTNLSS